MSAVTMEDMTPTKKPETKARSAEQEAALELVRMAKEKGLNLTGPNGLLKQFTKTVLETALDEEMTEHLGRVKHEKTKDGRAANSRNGTTVKTVTTDSVGPVTIEVPRDRDGSFEPVIVKKRQRRLSGVDEVVLSLYARGLTTGEISAHFREIYGASVSKETVSRITSRVVDEMNDWCSRPLERVYAAVFIDATVVKVRDGQVANRAFYVAVGVDLDGNRDVLGIWASPAAEGARYWLSVLTELKNRGVDDVFFLICDGLKGLPDAVAAVWPLRSCRPAWCICCATRSATRRRRTGTPSDATSNPSTPRRAPPRPRPRGTRCWTNGRRSTRRSATCGWTRGNGSSRSWTTTWRSAA